MEIKFKAIYGDVEKTVCISQPFGTGNSNWNVSIDDYHQGIIIIDAVHGARWYFNEKSDITTADIEYMIELIEGKKKPHG